MTRSTRYQLFIALSALALVSAGCSAFRGGGSLFGPSATEGVGEGDQTEGALDVRTFLGPDYCPDLRILDGAEVMRRYERGREDDPAAVIWQASFADTARECLYDGQGNVTIKVGVAGRAVAGPKGGAGEITVPFKIAVVKYKEALLGTEAYSLSLVVPATGSVTFAEVREITVPSPGEDRDYLIYVGFDVGSFDPMNPGAAIAAVEEEPAPPPPPPPPVPPEPEPEAPSGPSNPNVLPAPDSGFILSR